MATSSRDADSARSRRCSGWAEACTERRRAPTSANRLADGSLPIPSVTWSAQDVELRVTALAHAGQAFVEYQVANRSGTTQTGALVLAVRPVQINPYWQHGGHAIINSIAVDGRFASVNDRIIRRIFP